MSFKASKEADQKNGIAQALSQIAIEASEFMDGDLSAREKLVASARELVAAN